jgi:hypothetical protein
MAAVWADCGLNDSGSRATPGAHAVGSRRQGCLRRAVGGAGRRELTWPPKVGLDLSRQIARSSALVVAARRPSTCSTISVCRNAAVITTPTTVKMRARMLTWVQQLQHLSAQREGAERLADAPDGAEGSSRAPLRLPARER